ncbi:MAG: UDP-N-acetylmuramoyl-tripeptide--D-alanyl-D-alanine ligase [Acidimicrobiia bacterium]|nr:UDP-N-acetylmuramoyl-tripeptide--D-alanyl-D-alanine ligase [Acidimicrobiia bacterium]
MIEAAAIVAAVLSGLRWLRVAQREHYLAGAVTRFAVRWWSAVTSNRILGVVAVAALVATAWWTPMAWVCVATVAVGPFGLGIRGRSSPIAWTSRLRRVAVATSILVIAALALARLAGSWAIALVALLVPVFLDVALWLLAPWEKRSGDRWVEKAASALDRSGARVVAITGSYGKTSTKVILSHLLGATVPTFASPASFNNRMGLARAINEGLTPGIEVFVAEMGTYGPGEIAELCSWIPPEVAVMTAIGPVHLERMKSEERIAQAKREILERARVGVVNVDHPLLSRVADEEAQRIQIVRCSTIDRSADVFVDPSTGVVVIRGRNVGSCDVGAVHPSNVAAAVGAVTALGLEPDATRLAALASPPNRQVVGRSEAGAVIIDDTFNSNPDGARAALGRLGDLVSGRRAVVTPGMVELGPVQAEENRNFARAVAETGATLVVVGHTNRRALLEGASASAPGSVIVVQTREEAVAWVRANLGEGDGVLYENDLPDHYP